jgi:Fe-S-cluster containining protein
MGPQCRGLPVTVRVGPFEDGPDSLDHESTWLLGHTQNITFGKLWVDEDELYVDAVLHVACRFLKKEGAGARCGMYGYRMARLPRSKRGDQPRRLGGNRFRIVENHRPVQRNLPFESETSRPARSLPVLASENPCATAPCRTAEHTRGAACCRDLQVEIMCTREEKYLEALIRSRRSPYLCKIDREGDFSLEVEMISACGYLGDDGIACTLHGRRRLDGRPAKPDLCSEWPPKKKGLHPGCVFAPGRRKARARG